MVFIDALCSTMDFKDKRYFILQEDYQSLTSGSLWKRKKTEKESIAEGVLCQGLDNKKHSQILPYKYIRPLHPYGCKLLYGVSDFKRRLEIIADEHWLDEAVRLKVGDKVDIKARTDTPTEKVLQGTIRFIGSLPDFPGMHFGVDLLPKFHGQGSTDGVFRRKRLFICKPNCGLFVDMYKVRCLSKNRTTVLQRDVLYGKSEDKHSNDEYSESKHVQKKGRMREVVSSDLYTYGQNLIDEGERVIWYSDLGPEYGTIKKLVVIDQEGVDKGQLIACVEFDNPVGTGSGYYDGERIFDAPSGHASFIPLCGLIKESDVAAAQEDIRDSCAHKEKVSNIAGNIPGISHVNVPPTNLSDVAFVTSDGISSTSSSLSFLGSKELRLSKYQSAVRDKNASPVNVNLPPNNLEVDALTEPFDSASAMDSQSLSQDVLGIEIGSKVEVLNPPRYGVVRWIGKVQGVPHRLAGLEMEKESSGYTDGTFKDTKYFNCPTRKALFVYLHNVRKDMRQMSKISRKGMNFGPKDSPPVFDLIVPEEVFTEIDKYCGQFKGIQGYHNSCYLDSTFFAMFAFTTAFDQILHRTLVENNAISIQKHLRTMIIGPLRKYHYVRADKVMMLRSMLSKVVPMQGLTTEEKDPEEFLSVLFRDVLEVEPFLSFSTGHSSYFLQLFLEYDATIQVPTVQQLMERTCMQSGIKLKHTPSVLILQMPRFGSDFKMYDIIFPSPVLDITDILEFAPRECGICGQLAQFECFDCFSHLGDGLDKTAFCEECAHLMHRHAERAKHKPRQIRILEDYVKFYESMETRDPNKSLKQQGIIKREEMELIAVLCIKTSHYVAFVRGGNSESQWLFFDSMSNRIGSDIDGYNVPEVKHCPEVLEWLKQDPSKIQGFVHKKDLPPMIGRFMCDAYLCFYQNSDAMMYQ